MGNIILGYWWRLYHNMTPAELKLEPEIAKLGTRYRCQHPFRCGSKSYFADFYLADLKLIIEVDDDSHNKPEKQKKDRERTKALQALGLSVIRFTNDEVLNHLSAVVEKLATYRKVRPYPSQEPSQPLPTGESPSTPEIPLQFEQSEQEQPQRPPRKSRQRTSPKR